MKIRIQGNSIRLRLSQTEVHSFGEKGMVEDRIQFGAMPDEVLIYSLEKAGVKNLSAGFAANHIRVLFPAAVAVEWIDTELVGIDHEVDLGNGRSLKILVEKDFQCLAPRGENESDNFPNPKLIC